MIVFTLTMPNRGSWNGQWSGQDKLFAIVTKSPITKDKKEQFARMLEERNFYYNFGDGWTARIEVTEVDAKEGARIKKKSAGFCGYNWMVTSLITYGEIRT